MPDCFIESPHSYGFFALSVMFYYEVGDAALVASTEVPLLF